MDRINIDEPAAPVSFYADVDGDEISMADFPVFRFSKKEVGRAGKALARDLIWTGNDDENAEMIRHVFSVAYNWRDSHAYPMRCIRGDVSARLRSRNIPGVAVARLKRMPSIRRKMRVQGWKLDQIQDLGGCRAILDSMKDVRRLIEGIKGNTRHDVHSESDYLTNPKPDGYRCHHLILKFVGDNKDERDAFEGRRIEIQVRTRLQHAWATAVEAIGLSRGEDLKAGIGNSQWLKLFQLMSAEFARLEGSPEPPNVPPQSERVGEIVALEQRLGALLTLQNLRHGFQYVNLYSQGFKAKYYLIKYNHRAGTVEAEPFSGAIKGAENLDLAESNDNPDVNVVLVEADAIDQLMEGFPNYFGDVRLFVKHLADICERAAPEYYMAPQETAPRKPKEVPDLSWWFQRRRRRWTD